MKTLCSALLDCLVLPLQDKLEDWRKTAITLDKDHAKEYKKLRAEIKKKCEIAAKAQKKRSKTKKTFMADASAQEVTKHYKILVDTERNAVRRVLNEERSR